MIRSAHLIVITSVFLLCCLTDSSGSSSGDGESKLMCKEAERRALLEIKDGLYEYEENVLRSWGEEEAKRECCEWIGIRCDNESGHVVRLDLSPSTFDGGECYNPLGGNYVSSSLVQLQYLNYLDLSWIIFYGNSIPSFIGNLRKLRYLDLSSTSLTGQVPPQLGNLSSLMFLNLSNTYDEGDIHIKNLEWASRLSSLRVLDLSFINLASAYDWARVVSNLPCLTELALRHCHLLNVVPPSLPLVNSSKVLAALDLSRNSLSGYVFRWVFNFSHSLARLDLSHCSLTRYSVPRAFESMASLEYLSLASNLLEGSIPRSLGNITTLKHLDLSSNKLEGSIPQSFGNIPTLEYLNLQNNMLKGEIPKSIWEICALQIMQADSNNLSGQLHFAQSSSRCAHFSLEYLDLSRNQITGSLPNFTHYPSLTVLMLSSNRFNGNVSETIGRLSRLGVLHISKSSLNAVMSEAHFSKLFSLYHLDLSDNPRLGLNIPSNWTPPFQLETIYLGSCQLGPRFPKWLQTQKHLSDLDISNSRISDSVPDGFWNASDDLLYANLSYNRISGTIRKDYIIKWGYMRIDLTSNQFEGSIPVFFFQARETHLSNNKFSSLSSICQAPKDPFLSLLDISYNQLEGDLPDCWFHFVNLRILVLTNNKLSGRIPDSIGWLIQIGMLHLGNNNFTGKLPFSLTNCTVLEVLDLGENRLQGPIPTWIGVLRYLLILGLRSNQLNGSLPLSLCRLVYVQILDLSMNNFSGSIPSCIGRFVAMRKNEKVEEYTSGIGDVVTVDNVSSAHRYPAQVTIIWKGKLSLYKNTLRLVKSIDLSHNKLVGKIPREVTELEGLVALNLSRNCLTGQIPSEIGRLKSLDVLDLSRNHLLGRIPSSMSELNFIDALDVSSNNLSGKIPTSTQLQSFDPASYAGNPELCGDPLPKKCPGEEEPFTTSTTGSKEEEQDSFLTRGFYVSLGLGFVVGFWGICGSLLFVKSWRYAYFKFLNGVGDWFYVMIALRKEKLLGILKH